MLFLKSLFLWREGNYHFLGTDIKFKKNDIPFISFANNPVGSLGESLLSNRKFCVFTFGYLHTFIHEMGHAIAIKISAVFTYSINLCYQTSLLYSPSFFTT
jgi:hypothetical protein